MPHYACEELTKDAVTSTPRFQLMKLKHEKSEKACKLEMHQMEKSTRFYKALSLHISQKAIIVIVSLLFKSKDIQEIIVGKCSIILYN